MQMHNKFAQRENPQLVFWQVLGNHCILECTKRSSRGRSLKSWNDREWDILHSIISDMSLVEIESRKGGLNGIIEILLEST